MDWKALRATMPAFKDNRLTPRAARLLALESVLDGKQYDALPYAFSTESTDGGEYVPLTMRRPSVRTGLCRVAIDDAVSLLFSEGHWPGIKAADDGTTDALTDLVKQTGLNETMLEAATRGSVGSVVIRMRVLANKPFYDVLPAYNLTPEWRADDPDTLASVAERYVVKGRDLAEQGYPIPPVDYAAEFWFQRVWDDQAETWFTPVNVLAEGDEAALRVDPKRTVIHGLEFVPLIWVRNLPSIRRDGPDGGCAFETSIDTVIEADYLLSQGGRGLKYASDPTLVIKAGEGVPAEESPARTGGAANALELPPTGDAKLLEINGQSAKAVLEHVQQLRAIALENMHGNRANADKLSAATSGRSIELMMTGLIWMADRLRISYGEGALLDLLRMTCAASQKLEGGLLIGQTVYKDLKPDGLELRWAPWMPPMPHDILETAQGLVTAYAGGVLSQETAAAHMGDALDVDDVAAEFARITAETAVKAQAAADAQASLVRQQANVGKTDTRQATA